MGVLSSARCNRAATHQISQIRAEASVRWRSAHRMAVHAGISFKHPPASDDTIVLDRGFLLGAYPGGKILRRIHRNAEEHFGVLHTAVLGTLTNKDSGALRVHPHFVGMVRNK